MRARIVIAASIAGFLAGAAPAWAADLPLAPGGYGSCCYGGYGPEAAVVIYDDQPGVTMRRWWLPPWRNRHYYPHGRERLRTGDSRPRAGTARPRPARSFARHWTNPADRRPTPATLLSRDGDPSPPANPYSYAPPVVVVPTVR